MVPGYIVIPLAVLASSTNAVEPPPLLDMATEDNGPSQPALPFFLGGNPADEQVRWRFRSHRQQARSIFHNKRITFVV